MVAVKTFIIAEVGVNHNGDIKIAFQLIDAAVEAGADAVKFQTFITEENISKDTPLANHHLPMNENYWFWEHIQWENRDYI